MRREFLLAGKLRCCREHAWGPDLPVLLERRALMLAGAGAWATTVFADVVHDMLIHFLWGDILFAAGALELARRRGVYDRPWLDEVLPVAFLSTGALFILHQQIPGGTAGEHLHRADATRLFQLRSSV